MNQVLGMRVIRTPEGHLHVSNPKAIEDLVTQYKDELGTRLTKHNPAATTIGIINQ